MARKKSRKKSPPISGIELIDERCYSLRFVAEQFLGLSIDTLRRLIAAGEGPTLTRISPQRVAIRGKHVKQWLDSRAKAAE